MESSLARGVLLIDELVFVVAEFIEEESLPDVVEVVVDVLVESDVEPVEVSLLLHDQMAVAKRQVARTK
jgi:hypothetical protein